MPLRGQRLGFALAVGRSVTFKTERRRLDLAVLRQRHHGSRRQEELISDRILQLDRPANPSVRERGRNRLSPSRVGSAQSLRIGQVEPRSEPIGHRQHKGIGRRLRDFPLQGDRVEHGRIGDGHDRGTVGREPGDGVRKIERDRCGLGRRVSNANCGGAATSDFIVRGV